MPDFGNFLEKKIENLAEFEMWLDIKQIKKIDFARVTHPDARSHFIVQRARQNCLLNGQCSLYNCNFLYCEMFRRYLLI